MVLLWAFLFCSVLSCLYATAFSFLKIILSTKEKQDLNLNCKKRFFNPQITDMVDPKSFKGVIIVHRVSV